MKKFLVALSLVSLFLFLPLSVFAGNPPVEAQSSYTSPSGTVPSDGSSTETFSIHLQDSNNQPVVGDTVSVSSSNDSTALFPQNNQTTDSSGNATFTMTTTTPGVDNVTLYDSTNNITFTDWFTVTFYDASKGCSNVPAAPVLSSVVSNSNNKATLTWVDSADPVSNYLVSYGTATKNYIYGDPNVGAQGTTSFTVGSLAGGKKYYFVVAANNNCGTSGFSNEISVIAAPIPATAAPTAEPTTEPVTTLPTSTPITTFVTTQATDAPVSDTSLDTPTPTPAANDINSTFKTLGIGILILGILLIGGVFIYQKMKSKNKIPPMTPQQPTQF